MAMNIKVHESRKNESSEGRSFYDKYINDRAHDIIAAYDVNEACGAMCDAWYELGDGAEAVERDDRSGYISYNDGGWQKTWTTTSWRLTGQGYTDKKIDADYEYLQEQCEDDYKEQCDKDDVECDLQSDDFYDFEERWWDDGCDIFAYAEIVLISRGSYKGEYTLHGRISRSFDYTYGRDPDDDLDVVMEFNSPEQLTEANANKFFEAVESAFGSYRFADGFKEINIQAE